MALTNDDFWEALNNNDAATADQALQENPSWKDEPDFRGFPPVVLVAYRNQVDMLEVLGKHKADLSAEDSSGNSALMGAVYKQNREAIEWLVKNGADVNHQNPMGATALSFAYDYTQPEVFELLLQKGADPSLENSTGHSMVKHIAANGPEWAAKLIEQYHN